MHVWTGGIVQARRQAERMNWIYAIIINNFWGNCCCKSSVCHHVITILSLPEICPFYALRACLVCSLVEKPWPGPGVLSTMGSKQPGPRKDKGQCDKHYCTDEVAVHALSIIFGVAWLVLWFAAFLDSPLKPYLLLHTIKRSPDDLPCLW